MDWQNIVTPALISTLITALLAPSTFYFLKRRDEKRKRNFEVRFAEYKKYLQTMEEISEASRVDFEKIFSESISANFKNILENPENSNDALLALNDSMNTLTGNLRESFTKATNELHGLRLVCSEKLLNLIDEFVQLQRELMDHSVSIMSNWQNIDIQNPEAFLSGEMKQKASRVQYLYDEIIKQMRKELRIE